MLKLVMLVAATVALIAISPSMALAPPTPSVHVWTMDFLKVKPGMFQQALGLLDVGWERTRAEAKKEGMIVSYGRVGEEPASVDTEWDIILLTEYKDDLTYEYRERLFTPIMMTLFPYGPPQIGGLTKKDLYEIVATRVLHDYPENGPAHLLPVKP